MQKGERKNEIISKRQIKRSESIFFRRLHFTPYLFWFAFFMLSRSINTDLLEYAGQQKFMKPFAFYIMVKNLYRSNSVIYNYSPKILAKNTNLNRRTVDKYVTKLKQYKFAILHSGNLLFRKQSKVSAELGNDDPWRIKIDCDWTFEKILNRLNYELIKIKGKRQKYQIDLRAKINSSTGENNDKVTKSLPVLKLLEKCSDKVMFSSRSVGGILGVSHTRANNILKELEKLRLIKTKEIIRRVKKMCRKKSSKYLTGLNEFSPGYFFWSRGFIRVHLGRSVEFV